MELSGEVIIGLVGLFTGITTLLTFFVRLLLKLTRQNGETQERLTTVYKETTDKLVSVITDHNKVTIEMKTAIDQNTRASEKTVEANEKLRDLITERLLSSTR